MDKKLFLVALLTGLLALPAASIVYAEEDDDWGDDWGDDDDGWGDDEDTDARPLTTIWEVDFDKVVALEVLNVSRDNLQYGRYNGLSEKGLHLNISLDMISRPDKDEGESTAFWTLRAENLGMDTSSLDFSGGKQGNYKVRFSVDNHLTAGNDSGYSPFLGKGSDFLYLPSDWSAANTTDQMGLDGNLFSVDPELERNQLMLEVTKTLGQSWSLTARYAHERKSGERVTPAAFYIDTANPHAAMLPAPVDYDHDQLDLVIDYVSDFTQMQFSYLYSELDNRYDILQWQNPYNNAFISAVDYPNGNGGIDLPSDLKYQQVRFNGNLVFSPKIKFRIDGSMGESELDDDIPAYTVNSALQVDTPLPFTSSSDTLDTSHLYTSLLLKPWRSFYVDVNYRFNERENGMKRFPWQYVEADSADQSPALKALYNTPYEYTREEYGVEATLRLPKGSRLTFGYEYEETDRNYAAVNNTEEDKGRIEFKTRMFSVLTARLEVGGSNLSGDIYEWSQSFFNRFTVDQMNLIPDDQRFNDHPLLRQYHLANRESEYAKLNLAYMPSEKWNFMLDANYTNHDYDKSELGLIESSQAMANLSANYMPSSTLVAYLWLGYGKNESEQMGREFRGGIEKPANVVSPPLPQGSDPSRNWAMEEEGINESVGAGIDWQVVENKVWLVADYVYLNTTIEDSFLVFGARDLTGAPLPDQETRLHQFKLLLTYSARPDLTWRFGYEYYRFVSEDWAMDNVAPDTMRKVLWLGEESPNDVINVFSVSATYRF